LPVSKILNNEAKKKKAKNVKNSDAVEVEQVQPPKLISLKTGGSHEHLVKV
jgi:hypothetical protein